MPICTACTAPVDYLYTEYQTAHNLRLEQCASCLAFSDPYVEHDDLTILLDLILLKLGVFRHLLFNRGASPRRIGPKGEKPLFLEEEQRRAEYRRRWVILKLGSGVCLVDAFVRWSHFRRPPSTSFLRRLPIEALADPLPSEDDRDSYHMSPGAVKGFFLTLGSSLLETISFHVGIILACATLMRILRATHRQQSASGVSKEFRLSHVPLALLYACLIKLFLLFLLVIWRPLESTVYTPHPTDSNGVFGHLLAIFDESSLDREWLVRSVLGGLAAGFGLRVVLDCHPFLTTLIVLFGWAAKAFITTFVQPLLLDADQERAWLMYSIP